MKLKRLLPFFYLSASIFAVFFIICNASEIKIKFENFASYLYPKESNRNAELLKILLTIGGGLGVLYSLRLAYKKSKVSERSLALQAQAINKQSEQLELSRKSQVDERFKNAIEHLGNDKEPIILGGVVELHQIAKEDEEKYAAVVFNILTSYLRSTLKVDLKRNNNFSETIPQTIVDFLFKEPENYIYKNFTASLSHCNFLGLDISGTNFTGADFSFSLLPPFDNSCFNNANFGRTNFSASSVNNSKFRNADFHDCLFYLSEFKDCDFFGANLNSQVYINSKFFNCTLFLTKLYNSKFIFCHFENTYFTRAELLDINFWASNFRKCDFSENSVISKISYIGSGFHDTTFNSQCHLCNFSGIHIGFNFEFIQPKDLQKIIGRRINKNGIIELNENYFLNCSWETLTKQDYDLVIDANDNLIKNWKKKYEPTEKNN